MKKIFILFSLLTYSVFFSQEIEGLGIFKLAKFKENQIDSIAVNNKIAIEDCDSYSCELSAGYKFNIKKLKPNKSEAYKSPSGASYSENISAYSINNYKLNGKYDNKRIALSFYKNILYKIDITSPDSKLIDDLELKFGKGELKKRESSDKCRIGGESFDLGSSIYTKTWTNNLKNLSMTYMLIDGHSSDCEARVISTLYLIDNNIYKTADNESSEAKEKFKSSLNVIRREELKDL